MNRESLIEMLIQMVAKNIADEHIEYFLVVNADDDDRIYINFEGTDEDKNPLFKVENDFYVSYGKKASEVIGMLEGLSIWNVSELER